MLNETKAVRNMTTIKDYAMEHGGEMDCDTCDTEIDTVVAFCHNYNERPEPGDYYELFVDGLGKNVEVKEVVKGRYGDSLVCDYSGYFREHLDVIKPWVKENIAMREFSEPEYNMTNCIEGLVSGYFSDNDYKSLCQALGYEERGLEAALNAAKAKQEQTVAVPDRMTMEEAKAVLDAAVDKIYFYSHENAGKSIENFERNYEAGAKMLGEFAEKHLQKQEFTGAEIAGLAEYLLERVDIYSREAGVLSNVAEMIQIDIDGDWKHDHARANMTLELMGIKLGGEELVEETGDDWYSSRHIFNCSGMFGPERNIEIEGRHNTSGEER